MGTRRSKELVGRLLLRKKELTSCRCLEAVHGVRDDVNAWLGNLMRSTNTRYPLIVVEGCCYSWRLAVEHAEKKFDPQRFTS